MVTSSSGLSKGSGLRTTAPTTAKTALSPPTPMAMVASWSTVAQRARMRERTAWRSMRGRSGRFESPSSGLFEVRHPVGAVRLSRTPDGVIGRVAARLSQREWASGRPWALVRRCPGEAGLVADHCARARLFPIFVQPLRVRAGTTLGFIATSNTEECFTSRRVLRGRQVRGPTLESSRGLFYHFMREYMIVWSRYRTLSSVSQPR
jgi:hypothetical protein